MAVLLLAMFRPVSASLDRAAACDALNRRRPERVNRLRIVAYHGQAGAPRLQRQEDTGLEPVGVLVLGDQHVIEALADMSRQSGLAYGLRPVQQQVVVIEDALGLLGLHIGREQLPQLRLPGGAPGKMTSSTASNGISALTARD